MIQGVATTADRFGSCTESDLEDLDDVMAKLREAEAKVVERRADVAAVMGRMLSKGAHRKAIAGRAQVSDQTVTFTVHGRPSRRKA